MFYYILYFSILFCFPLAQRPLAGQGLKFHDYTHLDTPRSVGLFWASDQHDAVTFAGLPTTFAMICARERHALGGVPNSQSQQASGANTRLAPLGHWDLPGFYLKRYLSYFTVCNHINVLYKFNLFGIENVPKIVVFTLKMAVTPTFV